MKKEEITTKKMRIIITSLCLYVVTLFFCSCETLSRVERNDIIYTIPPNAQQVIYNRIQELKKTKKYIYVMFEQNCNGYQVTLIPTSSLKQKIQNLDIKNTRRVLMINNEYYHIIFSTDMYLGGYMKSVDDKKEGIIHKEIKINENTVLMQFDKEWKRINF